MVEAGFITAAAGRGGARREPIVLRQRDATEIVHAPYFTEEVRRELEARYGEKALYEVGPCGAHQPRSALQGIADQALRDALIAYDRRHGYRGPVTHIALDRRLARGACRGAAAGRGRRMSGGSWRVVLADAAPTARRSASPTARRGRIPYDELSWARRVLPDDAMSARCRPRRRRRSSPGDVVLVEPLPAAPGAKGERSLALRQIPEVSGGAGGARSAYRPRARR